MRLAVVIPASDDPPTLGRCLTALEAGKRRPDELIVQREPRSCGPAAARNAGAGRSAGDVLVFVDSDVEVHPDALARIEERFRLEPDLCGVFGSYDDEPAASGLTSRFRNLLHHHVHLSAAGEAETFWAGLGAVRRADFEAVGGFDAETYREPSIEDIALGMKLRAGGGRLRLDPAIRGRHLKAWTPLSMVRTDFWRRGVPWGRLLLARRHRSGVLNLGLKHRASAASALGLLVGLLGRRPRMALTALLTMVALNRDFYALLVRRGGPRLLAGGVVLHVLHLLTAVASVPVAAAFHLRDRRVGRLIREYDG